MFGNLTTPTNMATEATIARIQAKSNWLRANPHVHQWLIDHTENIGVVARDPVVKDMAAALKAAGIYGQKTIAIDICAAMRRLARTMEVGQLGPNEAAAAEIETVLARPGLNRALILSKL
jgi:hypothetical protein